MLFIIIVLGLLACGSEKRQTGSVVSDAPLIVGQSVPDTISSVQEKTSKTAAPVSSSASRYHQVSSNDNMRGFDPASENDMDDNGMSRYMENDDDEGWD